MLEEIERRAKTLPQVRNFFSGLLAPKGFKTPEDVLLYWHDFCWPKPLVSSRYMLVLPFVKLDYMLKGEPVHLKPGQAILVNPFLPRWVPDNGGSCSRLLVSFVLEGEQEYLPEEPVMNVDDGAWRLAGELVESYLKGDAARTPLLLALLLAELSKNVVKGGRREVSQPVLKAMSGVNQHIGESFGIKELAATAGRSASHLRKLFREEMDMSLGEYVAERRLASARRLLAESSASVGEVARACGYKSIYAFSRFFKNAEGVSPLKYRRSERAGRYVDGKTPRPD